MSSILKVSDVTVRFGGVVAANGVSFEQNEGEFLAIIGPNGAGKTTIFSVICGIYLPEQGASVRFSPAEGQSVELLGRRPHNIARLGLSRTMQNLGLFHGVSVMENLLMGRYVHRRSSLAACALALRAAWADERAQRRSVEGYLELLGLRSVADEPVESLPYGFQKRVELGRALLMEPRLLLLDEPFAGMGREDTRQMSELLTQVKSEFSTTLLMIEHDMEVVMQTADRILVLDHGAVIAAGTPDQVSRDEAVIEAYLGRDED